jgi:hypothetical protein
MAQISYYKLDEIRKRLIGKRFANQLAEINNTLSEKIYDVVAKAIPAEVLEVFNKVEQDHINYVIEYRKNPHISYVAPIYFNTMSSVSSWYSVDANEFMFATPELKGVKCNHTYNIPLPKPLPCTSKDFGRIVLHEIIKKGELFNLFVQMYKTIDARDVLNNKISNESPLGIALIGKKKGEVVEVAAPNGTFQYKILEVVKSKKSRKKKEDK